MSDAAQLSASCAVLDLLVRKKRKGACDVMCFIFLSAATGAPPPLSGPNLPSVKPEGLQPIIRSLLVHAPGVVPPKARDRRTTQQAGGWGGFLCLFCMISPSSFHNSLSLRLATRLSVFQASALCREPMFAEVNLLVDVRYACGRLLEPEELATLRCAFSSPHQDRGMLNSVHG